MSRSRRPRNKVCVQVKCFQRRTPARLTARPSPLQMTSPDRTRNRLPARRTVAPSIFCISAAYDHDVRVEWAGAGAAAAAAASATLNNTAALISTYRIVRLTAGALLTQQAASICSSAEYLERAPWAPASS